MKWDDYKEQIKDALDLFEFDEKIPEILRNSIKKNQTIFVAGNGGSAAMALHYSCDLSKGASKDWKNNTHRLKVICLSANVSYMTAIANDENYDEVFKQQLINLASKGDILISISSSGNSPNIVKATEWANENGLTTVGVSGFKGGKLKALSNYSAYLNKDSYEVCEDIHHIFGHFLTICLRDGEENK